MNHRAFLLLSYLLLSAMAVALVVQLIEGQWSEAAVLAGFLILTAVFIAQRDRLPRVFSFLFAFAGAANVFGYAFNLWKTPVWFDEAVHAYTSFAVSAAIGWLMFSRTGFNASGRSAAFSIAVAGIGLVLGVLWEVFEWAIGIIGPTGDTALDLVMDTLGAIAAGIFCVAAASRGRYENGQTGQRPAGPL